MTDKNQALRILDANRNRGCEALRTIEEYFRFAWDDSYLTELTKCIRHDFNTAFAASGHALLAMRDTDGDVGTNISTTTESSRASTRDVIEAAFSRLQQSLRVIEEYGKVVSEAVECELIEQLRYRCYQLHHSFASITAGRERLTDARIYAIISGQESDEDFDKYCTEIIHSGVDVIQLRDKHLPDRDLIARGKHLRQILNTVDLPPLFIMNDRPDLAVLTGADGVHVGQDELTVAETRSIVGPDLIIGVSTHNITQVANAVREGANYIGCGPTFPSGTKSFDSFAGVSFLREVSNRFQIPAFAIGGIDLNNIAEVVEAGFNRVAISGVLSTSVPQDVVSALQPLLT